ncbi:MAG TPA: hypothetical protein VIC71_07045 [Gammaproteobacteria bacterium]|jgi:hypothetical protein
MRRILKTSVLALCLGIFLFIVLLGASIHTYSTLTAETLIAEVRFERTGEQEYLAYLRTGDLCTERALPILGDQWRIDAQFLKWKYWALLLGLDSQYRLERFEGRYSSIDDENRKPTLAHSLGEPTAVDVVAVARSLGDLNFLIDTTYGSSTYQTIDTERIHEVYKTPTGIFTRSVARPSDAAAGEPLAVEIGSGCGAAPGVWQRVTDWTDSTARAALDAIG